MAGDSKFIKSPANSGTEKAGLSLLLADQRFQVPNLATKRRILELIGKTEAFGTQTFDAVMTPGLSRQSPFRASRDCSQIFA
jgi:hypothetical protein